MAEQYDNMILRSLGKEWNESKTAIWNNICRITGTLVNKKLIFDRIDYLESARHIESKKVRNRTQYRRKDSADNHSQFIQIMEQFEWNKKQELDRIKKLKIV